MMTRQQFEREKAELITDYGVTPREALRKRAQKLAKLYVASGLTAEELTEIEERGRRYIDQWLMFGRFLLATQEENSCHCTESCFRKLWLQTDDQLSEAERFTIVAVRLEVSATATPTTTRQLTRNVIAQFSDGKFHLLRDMATAVDASIHVIRDICDRIVRQGTFQTFGEKRPAPSTQGSYAYRFVKGGKKKIDMVAFYSEVRPVLDDMEKLINGHSVHFSQQAMKMSFDQFRKVIDRVAR